MWDPFQREVLEALGHVLYVPRGRSGGESPAPVRATDPATPESMLPPALMRALARAAGVEPEALPPLPPLAELRTPAGKRALWPRLRRLRRSRR